MKTIKTVNGRALPVVEIRGHNTLVCQLESGAWKLYDLQCYIDRAFTTYQEAVDFFDGEED